MISTPVHVVQKTLGDSDDLEGNLLALAIGRNTQHRAHGVGHPPAGANDTAHVVAGDAQLKQRSLRRTDFAHPHLVRLVHQVFGDVFDQVLHNGFPIRQQQAAWKPRTRPSRRR